MRASPDAPLTMRPLAIIENDVSTSAELRIAVEAAGFRTDCFRDGASALTNLSRRTFALAILDLDLLDTDPFSVCREAARFVPVIALASESGEEMCLRAFENGADDCVSRQIPGRELVARIRNVLRRAEEGENESDALLAAVSEMRIRGEGEPRDLTRGEAELLALLLSRTPTPLTVAQMAEILTVKRGTLESRIKSLRKKLGPEKLVSRGSLGYQLV
jgi:DNA-binding response OmpR family regulator